MTRSRSLAHRSWAGSGKARRLLDQGTRLRRASRAATSVVRNRSSRATERDVGAVVVAGGRSVGALQTPDRSWLMLSGRSLLARTLSPLIKLPSLAEIVVLVDAPDTRWIEAVLAKELRRVDVRIRVVTAIGTPAQSLHHAMEHLSEDVRDGRLRVLLIHDTAWPLASVHVAHDVLDAARQYGAAAPCLSGAPEIWLDSEGGATRVPLHRTDLLLQMPQAFSASQLLEYYALEEHRAYEAGSPAEVYAKRSGRRVRAVAGESTNIHITTPQDVFAAEALLSRSQFGAG